jgi:predicted ArsR family transcriptional regulator
MDQDTFDDQVRGIAALDHPMSGRVYRLFLDEGRVSRDSAAGELGVARPVAVFHLEKLVEAGLLEVHYERISGRTGPGAGRPAKLYRRSTRKIDITIPPRRYELAGSILTEAVARSMSDGIPVDQTLAVTAREAGRVIGAEVAARAGADTAEQPGADTAEQPGADTAKQPGADTATQPGADTATQPGERRAVLMQTLLRQGFEPREQDGQVTLLNCPFHELAEQQRLLICTMNRDFLAGFLDGIDEPALTARLAPEPGHCCVRLDPLGST